MNYGFDSESAILNERKRKWICKMLFVQHLQLNAKVRLWQRVRMGFYLRNP